MLNIISKSYYSRNISGPGKVAHNLIKGLEILNYPYVVNKRLDATQRLWIHDDTEALKELKTLNPKVKVLVGPNLFVLPEQIPAPIDLSGAIYLQHSEWVKNMWQDRGFKSCPVEVWPVGIDTEEFAPDSQTKEFVLVYFKQRLSEELKMVEEALKQKNIKYKILRYGSYSEEDYKSALSQSRFIIWLGIHESQGIALGEALACNVPVLVCDVVKSSYWNKEGVSNSGQKPYTVTSTAPYFDNSCGLKITDLKFLPEAVSDMENRISEFKPRQYIEQNLSLEKQAGAFLEIYNKYFGLSVPAGYKENLLKQGGWVNGSMLSRAKFLLKDIFKKLK